jgi:hypothetical protein
VTKRFLYNDAPLGRRAAGGYLEESKHNKTLHPPSEAFIFSEAMIVLHINMLQQK